MKVPLRELAHARSGDKGVDANICVIARSQEAYVLLEKQVTEERVQEYFSRLGVQCTSRYLLPKLAAMNFVLERVLNPLRIDAQGKALGQALLEMTVEVNEKFGEKE